MAKRLTEAAVQRLRADPKRRREVPDALVPGLYLIIQPSGRKSWAVRFRWHGRSAKHTVGSYPAWKLTDARRDARTALQAIAQGEDPRAAKRAAEADTIESVVADWLQRDQAKNRSHAEVKRMFERLVLPRWRARTMTSITRRDCIDLIDGIVDRGTTTYARRVHAHLHRMFRWAVGRGVVESNPMADLPKPGAEAKRDRVLSDTELVEVWRATATIGWPFGPAIKLLILTGARRTEIGDLAWPEVEDATLRLAGSRTKTGDPRTIPLSTAAITILADLPRMKPAHGKPEYVFTTTGRTPVSGWSRAKRLLDGAIVAARREAAMDASGNPAEVAALPHWRVHDLRRTVATGLQRLGCRLEIIEAVLGHVSGSRAGIVGIYQRHSFDDEKRRALDAWAKHVAGLVEERDASKVVDLRASSNSL